MFPVPPLAGPLETIEFLLSVIVKETGAKNIIFHANKNGNPIWYKGDAVTSEPHSLEKNLHFITLSCGWLILQGVDKEFNKSTLSQYCSQTMENAQRYAKIQEQALIDSLTKLPNREALMTKIKTEIERCGMFCILFIDLNNFKAVNDTFGHLTGDKIIKQIAQQIKSTIRDNDFLGRYGGDEFVVILPDTNRRQGKVMAVRIKKNSVLVSQNHIVTLSLGLAYHPEDGTRAEQLIKIADHAMYQDKRGRNCNG